MKKYILVFGLIAFFTCGSRVALACTCVTSDKIESDFNYKQWLKAFDGAMFTGTVKRIEPVKLKLAEDFTGDFLKVTFQVDRFWKGVETEEAIIYTAAGCCACGVLYVEGERYFVLAHNIEGKLRTDICTSPKQYSEVETYQKKLGKGRKPKAKQGKIMPPNKT